MGLLQSIDLFVLFIPFKYKYGLKIISESGVYTKINPNSLLMHFVK